MRLTIVELPDDAAAFDHAWQALCAHTIASSSDLVVLNEVPFAPWFGALSAFDPAVWDRVVVAHERWCDRLDELGAADVSRACSTFADRLEADPPRVAHRGQDALDVAAAGAVRRHFGDAWSYSRTRSAGDIAPLMAVVLACWGLVGGPPPAPSPAVAASR